MSATTAAVVATTLVRLHDVGRTFGTGRRAVVAVYGATLTIEPGASIAVTGPSGSGKSTLLHVMSGLETQTVGRVEWPRFGGNPLALHQPIGLVFQAASLIPSLDVRQNVELPMLFAGIAADEAARRAADALSLLDLAAEGASLPQELSGGQAQRVVLARVLAQRPPLILADEPTSKLDRRNADHVARVLVDVGREIGAAVVVATHDLTVARRFEQHWPMRDGRLHIEEQS